MRARGDSVVDDFDINSSDDNNQRITWRSDSETQQNNNPPLSRLSSIFSRVTNHAKESYHSLKRNHITDNNRQTNKK